MPPAPVPRVHVHFHPERRFGDTTVLGAIADRGRYVSQFVTGTSNGGLTAHPGGSRWRWESRLFEGRYDDGDALDRPVYGAWDRLGSPWGAAPRFGSAHFVIGPEVGRRSTFCFPDSYLEPTHVGGPALLPVLRSLADEAAVAPGAEPLDDYVEAHVHGGLAVPADVECVVLDPSFRGGEVEEAAGRLGCEVRWHPGFVVDVSTLDPSFRTPESVALAHEIADAHGRLTPALLGAAAPLHDPQVVKHVWHHLAAFGRG
ncbi:DUF3626 domain-containing protein [Nocardioides acrostichi]|uniref:DUF3626 domain-containing protein n=1 Tax=Nocardioides acrostichi TaxID=2784339 RepID=A0A930UW41_9ACTN|nr:DUF3626 domain-containing protein [Nocardioides acrostichi]MBF4160150.1 DUF3626 domain-containing protein [Nocardioides acrostichi]